MKRTQSKAVKPALRYLSADSGEIYSEQFVYSTPIYVLPADPESYDAMVEQMAKACDNARAALSAIGIRRNPRAARANKGRKV